MRTLFILFVSLGIMVGLEAAFFAVRSLLRRRSQELRRRLQVIGQAGGAKSSLLRRRRLAANPAIDSFLASVPLARRAEALLESADSGLTVAQLGGYSLALPAVALVLAVAFGLALTPALILVALGASAPTLMVALTADRRSRKLSEQLPEALDMMSRSLRAGHATSAAFQLVATEMPEPVSIEFGRAFEEQRLGLSLEQAILHMTERAPGNRDLKIFATSAIIQRQTGGNLAELLGGLAETIRSRYRFQGKLRALTAEGRASGVILALLPIAFVALLQVMNPEFFRPLVVEPSGRSILLYATVSWVAGVAWLYRLTKVDI